MDGRLGRTQCCVKVAWMEWAPWEDTVLYEGCMDGVGVLGGQWQRRAAARGGRLWGPLWDSCMGT
eukprot:365971-Chlamydomonas_euryale.AAC.1